MQQDISNNIENGIKKIDLEAEKMKIKKTEPSIKHIYR